MAKIEIKCTECAHEARVPEAFRGKKVRCLRCRAKLRVPGGDDGSPDESQRPRRDRPLADSAGAGAAKVRRDVQQSIREVLGDYEHAIESSGRGFDVDLRGVAFGLARTLVEDLLQSPGVHDVKLSGGTGECRLTITIEGAAFDPDDSFAAEDDDTEIFARPAPPASGRDRRPSRADERAPASEGRRKDSPEASSRGRPASPEASSRGRPGSPEASSRGRPGSPEASSRGRPGSPEASSRGQKEAPESSSRGRQSSPESSSRGRGDAAEADLESQTAEAERLLDAGDHKRAADLLERVVAVDKNHVGAVQSLGETYARMGDHERARRAFKHLGKLMPDDAEPLILHAAASVKCNRLEDARVSLADAIKIDPENARAYKYAAVLYERLGDLDRSRKLRAKYETLKGAAPRGSAADARSSRRGETRERDRRASAGDEL